MVSTPAASEPSGDRLTLSHFAILIAYGVFLLLLNPGRPWALTFHEVNFAEPAREFLQTGDWVVPRIVGKPVWDKPPLMHWLIAASMAVFQTEAEWAARFPTVLATLSTAALIASFAARAQGRRVGIVAGFVQLTTVYVLIQGRLAEADMLLCATVTGAFVSLGVATIDSSSSVVPRRFSVLMYFACAGLSFLAKGPLGLALVGSTSLLFGFLERRSEVWRIFFDPVGWGVLGILVLGWPTLAILCDGGLLANWWTHNVQRLTGQLGGEKDPFFYFYTIPWLLLPWTPFVLLGLHAGLRSRPSPRQATQVRLLGAWFLAGLALLCISAWKHKHYAIPILPPLSIAAAHGLERFLSSPPARMVHRLRRIGLGLFLGFAMAGALTGAAGWPILASFSILFAAGGLGLFVSTAFESRCRPVIGLTGAFATLAVVFLLAKALVLPRFDLYRPQAELALRTNDLIPADATLSIVEMPDPQIVYYLRQPLRRFDEFEQFAEASKIGMNIERTQYVIAPIRLAGPLDELGRVRMLDHNPVCHPRKTREECLAIFEIVPRNADRMAARRSSIDRR